MIFNAIFNVILLTKYQIFNFIMNLLIRDVGT